MKWGLVILLTLMVVGIIALVTLIATDNSFISLTNLLPNEQEGILSYANTSQGNTTELINYRTYTSKTFQNPDGSYTLSAYTGHIHYKDDSGDFVDTNEVFIDKGDYFEMTNASYKLYVAKNLSDPTFYNGNIIRYDNKYEGSDHTIYYKPHSVWWINKNDIQDRQKIADAQPVQGVLNGSAIYYTGAFGDGLDFEVGLRSDGFIKEIVIQNKSVAGTPPSANHRPVVLFRYTGSGLTVKAKDNASNWDGINYYESLDGFEINEVNPNHKSHIAKSYIKDSNDNFQNIKVYWIKEAGELWQVKVIPLDFMTDDNTIYPVRADTVTQYYTGAGDGYAREIDTNWNTCHDQTDSEDADDTATTMRGGTAYYNAHYIDRIFLSFNTSSLPDNANITSANVSMYMTSKNDEGSAYSYYAFVQGNQSSPTSLTTTDFPFCGDAIDNPTEGSAQFDIGSDLTLNAYNHLPLDSTGLTWVNKTGFTKLGFRDGYDLTDTPGPYSSGFHGMNQVRFSSSESASNKPYINISYTETPPAGDCWTETAGKIVIPPGCQYYTNAQETIIHA